MDLPLPQLLSPGEARGVALGVAAVWARLTGAVWLVPFAGGRRVPVTVRLALGLALTLALLPSLGDGVAAVGRLPLLHALAVLVKEAATGLGLGFVVALIFWGVRAAGRLAEAGRGAPRPGGEDGLDWPMADLMVLFAVLLFLLLGGHHVYILALARSFETLPLASFPAAEGVAGFIRLCLSLGGELLLLALSLAAPVLASLLLADLAIGMLARPPASPALVSGLGALRPLVGVGAMLVAVALLAETVPWLLEAAVAEVDRAAGLLGGP